jgi:perosamine synthetase
MDVNKVEELITDKTKAILPVHIYGHPVDMDAVMDLSKKYNLFVVEDATESLGSLYKGVHTGTIGHAGCYSFNGNKLITAGSGGMIVTNREGVAEYINYISTQAKTFTDNGGFYHKDIGFNYRMSNLNAAVGMAQLENIGRFIEAKKRNANYYFELLRNVKGLTLPIQKEWADNVFWLYSILIEEGYGEIRDDIIKRLKERGVETRPFFKPAHSMKPYKDCRQSDMSVTEDISKRGLNLPSSVSLTGKEIEEICKLLG